MDNDWSAPSPRVISVFNVWAALDRNEGKPHYPVYPVALNLIGSAFSLEAAERMVREEATEHHKLFRELHHVVIEEMPVGERVSPFSTRSEWLYDADGKLIDRRAYPFEDIYLGRDPRDVRFRKGDLCEFLIGTKMILGIVTGVPPTPQQMISWQYNPDASEDCYTILPAKEYDEIPIDALKIFRPLYKVSPKTEAKLRRAYRDFLSLPMRQKIANTAATAQFKVILDELGWKGEIEPPRWDGDAFLLTVGGVPGYDGQDDLRIVIRPEKAWRHMDRVAVTLRRLAGLKPQGKGYSLHKKVDYFGFGPGAMKEFAALEI